MVNFVFSDESGVKHRPARILSTYRYHRSRQEAIVAAITSNVTRLPVGDCKVRAWREAGLLYPSVVTGIIRTIKQDMGSRKLKALATIDLQTMKQRLHEILVL